MHAKIAQMLFNVVDELNELRPADEHLIKDLEAPLVGDYGKLDSAGLINFIAMTEEKATAELGKSIMLTDDHTLSQANQVFRTLGALVEYIRILLDEGK